MKEKRVMRRGQELSIATLVLIVLGVIILVLLVIGFTKGWDFIFGKFDSAPGKSLETAAQACNLAAQGGLKADYCLEFRKIDVGGVTSYINCEDSALTGLVTNTLASGCGGIDVEGTRKSFCKTTIKAGDWNSMKVGGQPCSSFACDTLGGTVSGSDGGCPPKGADNKVIVGNESQTKKVMIGTQACCISTR